MVRFLLTNSFPADCRDFVSFSAKFASGRGAAGSIDAAFSKGGKQTIERSSAACRAFKRCIRIRTPDQRLENMTARYALEFIDRHSRLRS